MNHASPQTKPGETYDLSPAAARVLTHIKARTITGRFASRVYDMPRNVWDRSLDELRCGGHRIEWTHGLVADDPTVTGGYILVDAHHAGPADTATGVSQSNRRAPTGRPRVTSRPPQEQITAPLHLTTPANQRPRDGRVIGR